MFVQVNPNNARSEMKAEKAIGTQWINDILIGMTLVPNRDSRQVFGLIGVGGVAPPQAVPSLGGSASAASSAARMRSA